MDEMTVFHRNEQKEALPADLKGGVVAIGNFDGVHRGHRSVLERALALAAERGVPALVLTFEPHPRTVFKPEQPVFRLTPGPLKAELRLSNTRSTGSFRSAPPRTLSKTFWPAGCRRAPSSPVSISISAVAARAVRPI
jgi:cytidyltransferase-like protein